MGALNIVIIIWLTFFAFMAGSLFVFNRISIPRIDRQMEDDNKPKACPVDLFGTRALLIANAIALPLGDYKNPIIDAKALRPYGTRFDKCVALVLSISTILFVITTFIGGMLLPDGF